MNIDDLRSAGITRLRVHYSDLLGTTRAKVIPLELAEEAAEAGLNFCVAVFAIDHVGVMPDGTGLRDEVQFRDMTVVADLATTRIVPWERDTAICLSDCYFDGGPLSADPRGILKRAIAEAEQHGLRLLCGHELEFFLFRRTRRGLERYATGPGLVYRMDPRVDPRGVVRAMEDAVRGLGLPFVCVNQEYDPSQWEINTRYDDALKAADDAHLLKLAIKEIAAMHGLVATFMGRPMEGGTSGYHLHISAVDEQERNLFEDPDAEYGLSELARWFIGGVLAHGRGTTAVMAPTVNAYRRFVAQELAPYWINWGPDNRSVYVRIPGRARKGHAGRMPGRGRDGERVSGLGGRDLRGPRRRREATRPRPGRVRRLRRRGLGDDALHARRGARRPGGGRLRPGQAGRAVRPGLRGHQAQRGAAVLARGHRLGDPRVPRRPVGA